MNTSSENIVCVHRVTKKKVFGQLMLAVVSVPPSWQTKGVDHDGGLPQIQLLT